MLERVLKELSQLECEVNFKDNLQKQMILDRINFLRGWLACYRCEAI